MPVKETSDDNLIIELINNEKVILKYHTDSCGEICKELITIFDELANNKEYEGIAFLRIDASNNPKAKKYIDEEKQPIINIYHDGKLIEFEKVYSKEQIQQILKKLLNHVAQQQPGKPDEV